MIISVIRVIIYTTIIILIVSDIYDKSDEK